MSIFRPDLCVNKVSSISKEVLDDLGVKNILLDIDDTISSSQDFFVDKETKNWLKMLEELSVKVVIVSNNSFERVKYFGESLHIPYVFKALKPMPFKVKKVIDSIGAKKENTVIIGDQIFTDVLVSKILGIKSVLVEPIGESGKFSLKFKRYLEKFIKSSWIKK